VSLQAVPTVRAVWLVLTGMMLVSRVLFQAAGAARMRSFLDVWKVGRVRQCWGAVSLALAATVVVLLVRDRRDLDAIEIQLVGDDAPRWVSAVSVVAAVAPIGLAGVRTVPGAVRLGSRRDPIAAQSRLARAIVREHCFCFASIAVLLAVQLVWA
jgi:hypothetical protein